MELSTQKEKEAKKLNVPLSYLVLSDLMAIGYSEQDAYALAYPENAALSVQRNNNIRSTIVGSPKFRKLLSTRVAEIKTRIGVSLVSEDIELMNTEEVMKEILRSAKHQPVGSKERADLFAKYNDIRRDSEQGVDDDFESVSFYFPLKCHMCPLKLNADKKEKRG